MSLDPGGLRIVKCDNTLLAAGGVHPHKFTQVSDAYGPDPCWQLGFGWQQCTPTPDESTVMLYCLGDVVCEKELTSLSNLIYDGWYGFFVNDQFVACGIYDTCTRWAIGYMDVKLKSVGTCKKLRVCQKHFKCIGWWSGWGHRATIEICFPSGACILFDQDWWGGADHIFLGNVPCNYAPQ